MSVYKKRRKQDRPPGHKTQLHVMRPASTPSVIARKPEMAERKWPSLPQSSSNSSPLRNARMERSFDCGTDTQGSRADAFHCAAKDAGSDFHPLSRHNSHERSTEPGMKRVREFVSANNDSNGDIQTEIAPVQEPSPHISGEDHVQTRGPSQTSEAELNTREVMNQELIDALTLEMRTPSSSMCNRYIPESCGETTLEDSLAEVHGVAHKRLESKAQLRTVNPERRASQMAHRHKVILLSSW